MAVPDRVAVVTGTSAGLGLATARILLARGWSVIGVARRPASLTHGAYRHEQLDLGDLPLVEAFAAGLALDAGIARATRLGLVNDAAQLGPMRPLTRLTASDLVRAHAVNTVAPLLLSGAMARLAGGRPLRIVDVSSGAATRARAGRTTYSSTKAALRLGGMALAAAGQAAGSAVVGAVDAGPPLQGPPAWAGPKVPTAWGRPPSASSTAKPVPRPAGHSRNVTWPGRSTGSLKATSSTAPPPGTRGCSSAAARARVHMPWAMARRKPKSRAVAALRWMGL
jgi:NAD(P)-dependent dehydrogenase (short-subunit alcohol dehydrogenase family)